MTPGNDTLSRVGFKLFVTGGTARSAQAVYNLKQLCEHTLHGRGDFVVIDVLERPYLAEEYRILATPTLIKDIPLPVRRVVGDLSDPERLLVSLDLWLDKELPPENDTAGHG